MSTHPKRRKKSWQLRFKSYFAPTQFVLRIIGEVFQFLSFFVAIVVAACPGCDHVVAILSAFGIVGKTITNSLEVTRKDNEH